jgi:outer membrane lipoprotein-sorting protein
MHARTRPTPLLTVTGLLAGLLASLASLAAPPAADALVAAADAIRFPQEAFQVDVKVATTGGESAIDERSYRILSKGNRQTLVMTLAPASERGQILLMKDDDLWVFLPKVSQPVRLPLSQKLTGQVANGDLARANFAGDYDAKHLREETIDGRPHHVLELTAARRGVTYQRVLYWVDAKNNRPHKAEFYTVSGSLLKTARYDDFQKVEGKDRPMRLVLTDATKVGEVSTMTYAGMKRRSLDDKIFTKQYMKKLQ